MKRPLLVTLLGLAFVLCAESSLRAQFTIEQTVNGGYNSYTKGQTFTPSIGIDPDPGPVPTLDLTAIKLTRSMQGWSGPTSNFYLNIYDGDPVNGSGAFVGSSTNSIDVAAISDHSPLRWNFHYLTLDYTHEYWALVSSTNTNGGLDVYCGMREGASNPYAGGTSIAGTSSDPGGFYVKPTIDQAFEIELDLTNPLTADTKVVFETTASTVQFEFDAGVANAGQRYFLLCGLLGTSPGTTLPGGLVLPCNWDPIIAPLIIPLNNLALFFDFTGTLDANGKATPRFEWPGRPGSAGFNIYFAACTMQPFDFVSNAWTLTIAPEFTAPNKDLHVVYKNSNDIFNLGLVDYANPATVQTIGSLGRKLIRALEFAGDGKLYAYESPGWGSGQLYEVNPTNAALTPIGPAGSRPIHDMAYNPVDGKMYAVEPGLSISKMHSIDLSTGVLTFEGNILDDGPVNGNWMDGLAVDSLGHFYVYNNRQNLGMSEAGIYRSRVPGGLDFEWVHDLVSEFNLYGSGYALQTPAPLFLDWSSPLEWCFSWLREVDLSSNSTGWYRYHWNSFGLGWDDYPLNPYMSKIFYAWTAPPGP